MYEQEEIATSKNKKEECFRCFILTLILSSHW